MAETGGRSTATGLSPASLTYILGLGGVALMLLRAQVDPDAWWHLRTAAGIVATGQVPQTDTISWWSGGTPWISPSWLNELLLYFGNAIAGVAGQSLVYLPVYAGIVVLVERLVRITAPTLSAPWRLVTLAIMAVSLLPVMSPRAGNFDLLFSLFGLYGWLTFRRDGSTRWLWLMPIAAVAWANLHGGGVMVYFALALAFAVGTFVDRREFGSWRWRPFLTSVALTYLALGLTPYGVTLYVYPWSTILSSAQTSTIAEWRSPDFASLGMIAFRAMIAFGFAVGLARVRMTDAAGAFATGGMLFLALGASRYLLIAVPLVAIWFMPAFLQGAGQYLSAVRPKGWPRLASGYALLLVAGPIVILGALLSSAALPANQAAQLGARYPGPTLDELENCDFDHLWTDYGWGGWTAYQTDWQVGPYGAADALGDERLLTAAAVEGVTTDPGNVFDELGVEAVVTAKDRPLSFWLAASPGWRVVAEDQVSVAAVRQDVSCAAAATG